MKHFISAKFNILDSVIYFFGQKKKIKRVKVLRAHQNWKICFFFGEHIHFYDKVKKTTDSDNSDIAISAKN